MWAALLLCVLALVLGLHSVLRFFKSNTTINPLTPESSSYLVLGGCYRYSRNPMYLALALMLAAACFYLGAVSSFLCLPAFAITLTYLQIIPEERALEAKFGESYLDYRSRVRRWL